MFYRPLGARPAVPGRSLLLTLLAVLPVSAFSAIDADGDGALSTVDCNDNNPAQHPGATERCDGVDNDCDGQIDNNVQDGRLVVVYDSASASLLKIDVDTGVRSLLYGPFTGTVTGSQFNGLAGSAEDGTMYGTITSSSSLYRFDLDTLTIVRVGSMGTAVYGIALDGDGWLWGISNSDYLYRINPSTAASTRIGYVGYDVQNGGLEYAPGEDVLYTDAGVGTGGMIGRVDRNTGQITPIITLNDGYGGFTYDEVTGDFFVASQSVGLSRVNPTTGALTLINSATKVSNMSFYRDPVGSGTWYADVDGDGYGDPDSPVIACAAPADHVLNAADCDDADGFSNPGGVDVCDGVDNDCDGAIDEEVSEQSTWYADTDGDGFGSSAGSLTACAAPPGFVAVQGDCDDTQSSVSPVSVEQCNLADDDCDRAADEGLPTQARYVDDDGDGWGDPTDSVVSCDLGDGRVDVSGDCDDQDAAVRPDAEESPYNSIDDDCDPASRDDDLDGDGFLAGQDCDDTDAGVNPAEAERCGGEDEDCDGITDEDDAIDASVWFLDLDADGFGDATVYSAACAQPEGFVADDGDCDDVSVGTYPGAPERCDGLDQDCDQVADDGLADTDLDGVCDLLDACPVDASGDSDNDGACDSDDLCPGGDDAVETDLDGTPDACDACPFDTFNDGDGDGACDSDDLCPLDPDDDLDGDGVCADADICPLDADDDLDGDGACADVDLCPLDAANDADGDGVCGGDDTCPGFDDQQDQDQDGTADGCDLCPIDAANDADADGLCADEDLCPADGANDLDADGQCADVDPCPLDPDDDVDLDTLCAEVDACPLDPQNDADGDGVCESEDNCPTVTNSDQTNVDADGWGDACEPDNDGDGVVDDLDNCPVSANPSQVDADQDGIGDSCDDDDDDDGVTDGADSCLGTPADTAVLDNGCSVAQTCVCSAPWKNHGGYVSCVSRSANTLLAAGDLTQSARDSLVTTAGLSSCGRRGGGVQGGSGSGGSSGTGGQQGPSQGWTP